MISKTIVIWTILLFTLSGFNNGHAQNRAVILLDDCIANTLSSLNVDYNLEVFKYEQYLIDNQFLTNATPQSYMELVERLANDSIKKLPTKMFVTQMSGFFEMMSDDDYVQLMECQNEVLSKFDPSVNSDLIKLSLLYSGEMKISRLATTILDNYDIEDFQINRFKIIVFSVMSIIDIDSGIQFKVNEHPTSTTYDLTNALEIILNDQSEILVDGQMIDNKALSGLILKKLRTEKEKAVFVLKSHGKAKYSTYVDTMTIITDAYNVIRNASSQHKYAKELVDLTEIELAEIRKLYPQKIVEFEYDKE